MVRVRFSYFICAIFLFNNALADSSLAKKHQHAVATTAQTTVNKAVPAEPTNQSDNPRPIYLTLYRPTYILPAYYTETPDQQVYAGNTPNNQKVDNLEFKAQLSFEVPVIRHLFNYDPLSLNAAYTQLSYWQFYAKSQYFRETDYEPELFLREKLPDNQAIDLGVDHQSNGRGGDLERSWNRVYLNYSVTHNHWLFEVRPWLLIFQADSSDLHNPDIARYLGYGWVVGGYKFQHSTVTVMLRNTAESGFHRGAEEIDWSIPIHNHFNFFVQGFSGYGQSLIEYNHYTNAIGVGLSLNNWM